MKNPRKQKKLSNKHKIPAEVKRAAFEKSKGRCSNCNTMKNLEYDHKIPFPLDGKNDKENIRFLCENYHLRPAMMSLKNRAERF